MSKSTLRSDLTLRGLSKTEPDEGGIREGKVAINKIKKIKERGKVCEKMSQKKNHKWYLWKVIVASMPQPVVPLTHCQPAN